MGNLITARINHNRAIVDRADDLSVLPVSTGSTYNTPMLEIPIAIPATASLIGTGIRCPVLDRFISTLSPCTTVSTEIAIRAAVSGRILTRNEPAINSIRESEN